MQCRLTHYIQYYSLIIMNGPQFESAHLVPENNVRFVVKGIEICCDCGSTEITILSFGSYCRTCRSFRLYKNKAKKEYHYPTGTTLDLD